jgi:hypothetical protein
MASPTLLLKKSTVAGKVPTTSDLQAGEICLNFADAKIFGRHPGNSSIVTFAGGGGGGGVTSYNDLTDKPTLGTAAATSASDYATATHTHTLADITQSSATTGQVATWSGSAWVPQTPAAGGVTSVAGRTGAVTLSSADVSGVVANGGGASTIRVLTQAAYNAIATPDTNTVYLITA